MNRFSKALILPIALVAAPLWAQDVPIDQRPPPAGTYHAEPAHTQVFFSVSHLTFSNFVARFRDVEATVRFDPDAPETMRVTARVGLASVDTFYPGDDIDFDEMVAGPNFLNATPENPDATFESTAIALTGENTADVTGDLTLNGVTRPVVLHVTYNGGYAGHPLDTGARIGFSATASFKRSDFGLDFFQITPPSKLGVGDEVKLMIETELTNPDAPKQ